MLRVGFVLTGLVALYGIVWVLTYEGGHLGGLEFIFMVASLATFVIVIWVSIAIASAIRAGLRMRKQPNA